VANQPVVTSDPLGTGPWDKWGDSYPREFERWFHRHFKPKNPFDPTVYANEKEWIREAYGEWESSGRPNAEGHRTRPEDTTLQVPPLATVTIAVAISLVVAGVAVALLLPVLAPVGVGLAAGGLVGGLAAIFFVNSIDVTNGSSDWGLGPWAGPDGQAEIYHA
jgi:hypothetical protein